LSELVVCAGVSKAYRSSVGEVEALRGVDARFDRGAVTAVVGPSGSGKSTLLKVLAGLERPGGGSVLVDGTQLDRLGSRGLRGHRLRTVTYVSQSAAENFLPQPTLREQLALAGAEDEGRRLFERLGIGDRLDLRPRALSGGEQARAALALALLRRTPLVVSDEPTAELDEESAARVLAMIRDAAAEGTAFVVATHDDDVIAAADAVLRLDRGEVTTRAVTALPARGRVAAASETALAARGVTKSFDAVHAVEDVSLEVPAGALAALVGRSGSGKSTLLSLLGGWQQPDAGEVDVGPDGAAPAELDWKRLAYLPQRFGLVPELSVRENVELPARIGGGPGAGELLDALGLAELADRLPAETSVGQQQRTALARALALRPVLLLADEPTSHQDAGWREATIEVLQRACDAGTTCVIATHEPLVASRASLVWQMADGRVA
jgi:putative ABC transport system ATP-binding protein